MFVDRESVKQGGANTRPGQRGTSRYAPSGGP
jgi:hypothetical protein